MELVDHNAAQLGSLALRDHIVDNHIGTLDGADNNVFSVGLGGGFGVAMIPSHSDSLITGARSIENSDYSAKVSLFFHHNRYIW